MVQAHRYNDWDENSANWQNESSDQPSNDWNSLQDELEDLLDQVHMHSHNAALHEAPVRPQSSGHSFLNDPLSDPCVSEPSSLFEPSSAQGNFPQNSYQPATQHRHPADRHSQALLSVQRAMDRFSEPEEAYNMPAQSQRQLQNAIRQIRSSQRGPAPRGRAMAQPQFQNNAPFQNNASVQNNGLAPRRAPYREPAQPQAYGQEMAQHQRQNAAQLDGFGDALNDISSRLERFEHNFSGQSNSDAAVTDMASQVEQLSEVVEHLANNIGERGQIKQLENQIAKMADAIPSGAHMDFGSLNKRLDVLSNAFEKLRDLQAQQVELNIKSNEGGGHMDSIESSVRNIYERLDEIGLDKVDLEPVETCVRTVYDRIDALEQTMAMPTPAIERLSREMADFTKSMRDDEASNLSVDLIAQVGGLVSRIEQIETEGAPVSELKIDMKELQSSVVEAVEPRFAALEKKISGLSGKITKSASADIGKDNQLVETLGQHIRVLAEKLDKTSSDLNGLQKVFSETQNNAEAPNINAIADIVAQRTSQAMEKMQSQAGTGIGQKSIDQMEARLSGLFAKQEKPQAPEELGQVHNSIEQVNQRLARLETTLSAQAKARDELPSAKAPQQVVSQTEISERQSAQTDPATHATAPTRTGRVRNAPQRSRHPGLADEYAKDERQADKNWEPAKHLIPELRDNMPRPPAQDAPLKAPLFDETAARATQIPIPASLRVDPNDLEVMESEVHELDEPRPTKRDVSANVGGGASKQERIKLPQFNDANVAPPPAPASDFALANSAQPTSQKPAPKSKTKQASEAKAKTVQPKSAQNTSAPSAPKNSDTGKISRSTFIEAARRAAQSKNTMVEEKETQSIIGRAMARFQKKKADNSQSDADANVDVNVLPGDEPSPTDSKYAPPETQESHKDEELDDLTAVPESFLTRHRQPILLAATVVAVGFLTLNLINQRFSSADPAPAAAIAEMGTAISPAMVDEAGTPIEGGATISKGEKPSGSQPGDQPGVVGSVETTGGINQGPVRMISPNGDNNLPPLLGAPASIQSASLSVGTPNNSPVGLEMPPEAIGPLLLRQAAANGDARSQFEVAAIFAEGRALPQDLDAAAVWYERAAAQGFAPASYRLANMLENGIGVEKNLTSARLWYQLAADAGNRMSMHNLASLLASGNLGEQQFDAAAHWFENGASLGLTDSQFNLGMLYARGLGVTQSLENSFKWFAIAAAAGDEDAAKARDDIARSLDAQIVARLNQEVQAWAPNAMNIRANFAPIGTWSTEFDPGPEIEAREVIMRVQAALNGIGFDTGVPDGLIGPKTTEAITGFENQAGMIPSGKVNPRLLAVLGSQPV